MDLDQCCYGVARNRNSKCMHLTVIKFPFQKNERVTKLDLSDNWIKNEGAKFIADMISQNYVIAELVITPFQFPPLMGHCIFSVVFFDSFFPDLVIVLFDTYILA